MSLSILALSGSLRDDSLNSATLRTLGDLLPEGASLELFDYRDLPHYGMPDENGAVERLKSAISAADAVLLSTPEYNYSVSGVLKNAIDHASRPAYRSPFAGKPTGVMSASMGGIGGARAQQHLKVILLGMGAEVFPFAELAVPAAHNKVEGTGAEMRITDADTRAFIADFAKNFVAWAEKRA